MYDLEYINVKKYNEANVGSLIDTIFKNLFETADERDISIENIKIYYDYFVAIINGSRYKVLGIYYITRKDGKRIGVNKFYNVNNEPKSISAVTYRKLKYQKDRSLVDEWLNYVNTNEGV